MNINKNNKEYNLFYSYRNPSEVIEYLRENNIPFSLILTNTNNHIELCYLIEHDSLSSIPLCYLYGYEHVIHLSAKKSSKSLREVRLRYLIDDSLSEVVGSLQEVSKSVIGTKQNWLFDVANKTYFEIRE